MSERETLTWELFGTAGRELAQMVADDGYRPDIILSIARGGLFVAGALGYALDVKNLHVTNVEFYTGVDERLPMPIMLPPLPNVIDLSGQKVLIADDVADVRCAVVYEKPHSTVNSEYVWRRTPLWINFPWSTLPPVVSREGQVLDA